MTNKTVYQLSARQLLLLAFASALIAVGTVACLTNFSGTNWQMKDAANIASAEETPAAIADPSTVSDEQNSIDVYRTYSPGVAFITSTSVMENYYGQEFERESGSGSGSVIDNQGHILTNYHVIEGAQKLTVSLGGEKVFPAKVVGGDPDTDLAVIKIEAPAEGLTTDSARRFGKIGRRSESSGNRQSVRFGQNIDDRRNFRLTASDPRTK